MKRFMIVVLVAMMLGGLAGCETMKGLGKDIENLGEAMQGDGSKE